MHKKLGRLLIIILLISALSFTAAADSPELSAYSAILYSADTGDVLYEKNADERLLIASTTKIMTAITVLENCDPRESVEILPEYCCIEGSSMYITPEHSYTVRELLLGMMLVSGNDAATALAYHTAGSIEAFADMMNEKAEALDMVNSSFKNPHGLDEAGHYSTARDLALLASYCMNNVEFMSIVSTKSCNINDLTYVNHNKLLWNYEGCMGIKTGYTKASGRSLVSCCERDGMRLVCVTLGAPDDWNDHTKLYDLGYENYTLTHIGRDNFKAEFDVISGVKPHAAAVPAKDIVLLTQASDLVSTEIYMPKIIFAGFLEGEKSGKICVYINGELAATEDLVYTEKVETDLSQRLTLRERISRLFDVRSKPYYISER